MTSRARFAEIAALAGDPARAGMLHALMDGRALTATELARLLDAGLLAVTQQGRHRYFRVASSDVAHMIESIMQVAGGLEAVRRRVVTGPRDQALRRARTCYDHLAGELGVALADALIAKRYVGLNADAGVVTDSGKAFFAGVGMDSATPMICKPCLDWSERRPHIAGALGVALCELSFQSGWIRRVDGTRAVSVTHEGRRVFRNAFGLSLAV